MKTISLILLGSILTIGIQFIKLENIPLISNASASGNKNPCKILSYASESDMNNLYRFGYRVKGITGGGSEVTVKVVVMCKG